MFSVLITDDEPTIREGLRTLIDWESLGFAVVDTAANGKDALGKIAALRPDLLIADIRMPGMTGLELIEAVRKTGNDAQVLILSGYADFEYAKKAIGLKIDGYLLKPVDEDEFIDHLLHVKRILERKRIDMAVNGERRSWKRQKLLQNLLSADEAGQVPPDPHELGVLELHWNRYGIVLIQLQGVERTMAPGRYAAVRDRFQQAYDARGKGIVITLDAALVLLLPDDLTLEPVKRRVYADIAGLVTEPGMLIAAACGAPVASLGDIRRSYSEAAALLSSRFFCEPGMLIDAETVPHPQVASDFVPDGEFDISALADKLYLAIDAGSTEALAQLIAGTGRRLLQCGKSEEEIKSTFAGIVTAAAGKLSQGGEDRKLDNGRLTACMAAIYGHVRYAELERDLIAQLPKLTTGCGAAGGDKLIKRMLDLIQRNYVENLRLETLADVFNYNSAYLGKLFKSETGEYFNTYLDKVRIAKAKELLDEGFKVYQVAEKVGYANVDYFHGKFRKYVGVSPTSYRKK